MTPRRSLLVSVAGKARMVFPTSVTTRCRRMTRRASISLANEIEPVREAVAVFDTAQTLQNAIDELLSSGFHRAELSLLASEAGVAPKLGHKYRKSSELEDDPSCHGRPIFNRSHRRFTCVRSRLIGRVCGPPCNERSVKGCDD